MLAREMRVDEPSSRALLNEAVRSCHTRRAEELWGVETNKANTSGTHRRLASARDCSRFAMLHLTVS